MKNKKQYEEEVLSAVKKMEDDGLTSISMVSDDEPCEICDMSDVNDPHYGMFGYHRKDCTFCLWT